MFQLILSMLIFGTIGIFRRSIPLSSAMIACVRGLIGAVFLYSLVKVKGGKPDANAIRKNILLLVISGCFIGGNWMLLFEAYNYTSVAVATLCYYMAPVIVILLSPIILKERLTKIKVLCILTALIGMVFVSDVPANGLPHASEAKGIICGLGAAVLYASVMMFNKKIKDINAYDKTMVQLFCAGAILLPYLAYKHELMSVSLTTQSIILLGIVSIFHTGITYALYFGSFDKLPAQTVALFSYIDPITAILLSAVLLHEQMSFSVMIGTVLIIASTLASELLPSRSS